MNWQRNSCLKTSCLKHPWRKMVAAVSAAGLCAGVVVACGGGGGGSTAEQESEGRTSSTESTVTTSTMAPSTVTTSDGSPAVRPPATLLPSAPTEPPGASVAHEFLIHRVDLPISGVLDHPRGGGDRAEAISAASLMVMPDGRLFVGGAATYVNRSEHPVLQIPLLWTSTPASDWRRVELDAPGMLVWVDEIVPIGDGYLARATVTEDRDPVPYPDGYATEYWFSTDGAGWTRIAALPIDALDDVGIGDPWPEGLEPPPSDCLGGWRRDLLVETDTGLVAFCDDTDLNAFSREPIAIWELDGDEWRRVPDSEGALAGGCFHQVLPIGDGYVAMGDRELGELGQYELAPALWSSPDARDWERVPLTVADFGLEARIETAAVVDGDVVMVGSADAVHPTVWTVERADTHGDGVEGVSVGRHGFVTYELTDGEWADETWMTAAAEITNDTDEDLFDVSVIFDVVGADGALVTWESLGLFVVPAGGTAIAVFSMGTDASTHLPVSVEVTVVERTWFDEVEWFPLEVVADTVVAGDVSGTVTNPTDQVVVDWSIDCLMLADDGAVLGGVAPWNSTARIMPGETIAWSARGYLSAEGAVDAGATTAECTAIALQL